jgi:hypothetical protein
MADDIFPGGRTGPVHGALDRALRAEPGRVLSVLVRSLGDIDLAEDALQDAVATHHGRDRPCLRRIAECLDPDRPHPP